MALKVKLEGGVFVPLEPLPNGWQNGEDHKVERNGLECEPDPASLDDHYWRELEEAVCEIPEEDFQRLQAALDEHRREAKEWMRHRMGLS